MRTGARDKRWSDQRAKFARAEKPELAGYAEMKAHFTMICASYARAAWAGPPLSSRAVIRFHWMEVDRHRDPDGIRAGAKFVLDGMVAAGVLTTDTAADVGGFGDSFEHGCASGGVVVTIEAGRLAVVRIAIPVRLPDMNEILAARGRDGALTERTRQAKRGRT